MTFWSKRKQLATQAPTPNCRTGGVGTTHEEGKYNTATAMHLDVGVGATYVQGKYNTATAMHLDVGVRATYMQGKYNIATAMHLDVDTQQERYS